MVSTTRVNDYHEQGRLGVAVFASGTGTNLQALIDAQAASDYQIVLVVTDKPGAMAIERARSAGISSLELSPKDFIDKAAYEAQILKELANYEIELVVLAGYMRIVGATLLQAYQGRMLNLHPSLLPAFQGIAAPQQAIDAGVKISGCSVHLVDEGLDTGPIIDQRAVPVYVTDDAASLQARIQQEEYKLLVEVVQAIAKEKIAVNGGNIK